MEKCIWWVNVCWWEYFIVLLVKKDIYICSLYFKGGRGFMEEYFDLILVIVIKYEVNRVDLYVIIFFL